MSKRTIKITLALPDDSDGLGMIALRRFLKGLLRAYGLRCTHIEEIHEPKPAEGPLYLSGGTDDSIRGMLNAMRQKPI